VLFVQDPGAALTKGDFSLCANIMRIDQSATGPYASVLDTYSANGTLLFLLGMVIWRESIECACQRQDRVEELMHAQEEQVLTVNEEAKMQSAESGEQMDLDTEIKQCRLWDWHVDQLAVLVAACIAWRDAELLEMQRSGKQGLTKGKGKQHELGKAHILLSTVTVGKGKGQVVAPLSATAYARKQPAQPPQSNNELDEEANKDNPNPTGEDRLPALTPVSPPAKRAQKPVPDAMRPMSVATYSRSLPASQPAPRRH
jgi:hypothetical protein